MNIKGCDINIYQNFIFNQKNIYNFGLKRKDNINSNINPKKNYFSNNKKNINNLKYNNEYSSINSEDINYIPPPTLKDQILSPGDDDICLPKKTSEIKDKLLEDDICFYNIKNININNILNNNNKKLLILDLDETLVHSSFQPLGIDHNNKIIEPDIFLKILFDNKYYNLYVLTRPYINEFLKEMSKLFIIYIFTASIKEYANPLLNEIDKNHIISKRLFRDSCTITKDGKYVKNLNILNYNLKDVILLDNNPISYSFNKTNGIPIKSWHNDKNDKELIKIGHFLNFISSVDDVRYYIQRIVENDEINYYKINKMIAQQINLNINQELLNNFKKIKKIRTNNSNFNSSANSVTPHKKINFNNDDKYYSKIYTKTEINNHNISPINYREPKSSNTKEKISKIKNDRLPGYRNLCFNNNNLKININSINFNLDKNKSVVKNNESKYVNTDNNKNRIHNFLNYLDNENNKENENENNNNSVSKILINKKFKKKNIFHKHRLSVNNLVFTNKLNKLIDNNDNNNFINYSNIDNSNRRNNISYCYNCNSYNKKKKNSIYSYNLKKKKKNGNNIQNILKEDDDYNVNINLYKEKIKDKDTGIERKENNYEKINKIKVNKNISYDICYNKTSKHEKNNKLKIKSKNYENFINYGKINRNETFKGSKTFNNNKENDININNENQKNIENEEKINNGKQKHSIFSIFKQKLLSTKEPIKLKMLKKENKPEIKYNNNKHFNENENYYMTRKKGMVKEISCTEFFSDFNFYNNLTNCNDNTYKNRNTNYDFSQNTFYNNKPQIK